MIKNMSNNTIILTAQALESFFAEMIHSDKYYLPAKLSFYIQKNKNTIMEMKKHIEDSRDMIVLHYGERQADGSFSVSEDLREKANNELSELLQITQDCEIIPIALSDLDGYYFTPKQMEALSFMIEED